MVRSKSFLALVIIFLIAGLFVFIVQQFVEVDPANLIACPEEAVEPCEDELPAPIEEPDLIACSADAMQCPDGSFVGRTGPNCEFAPCPTGEPNAVDSFEDCVAAGNPVMESYPRQCIHDDEHFVEEVEIELAPFPIMYGMDQGNVAEYQSDCEAKGGVLNTCGSPCGPDAEVCITACAVVCEAP